MGSTLPPAVRHISKHVLAHLSPSSRPLFVAIQGPQGSGKTYLTSLLHTHLSSPPHCLNILVISIDDLYLPHSELMSGKGLLKGRGLPGTHDTRLGAGVLRALRDGEAVRIPVFEKCLFSGEGDRLEEEKWRRVEKGKLDVVILEGWCVGFYPIPKDEVSRRWEGVKKKAGYTKEDVLEVNERLKAYVEMWAFFDSFVQIKPFSQGFDVVYKWRTQQEHAMKAKNGGKGMTDESIVAFVDRYIPGYVFFGDGVTEGWIQDSTGTRVQPPWIGNGLGIVLGSEREVVSVEEF